MSLTAADIQKLDMQFDARNAKYFTTEQQQKVALKQQQFINIFIAAIITNAKLTKRI